MTRQDVLSQIFVLMDELSWPRAHIKSELLWRQGQPTVNDLVIIRDWYGLIKTLKSQSLTIHR
jgi:hypothetical protein